MRQLIFVLALLLLQAMGGITERAGAQTEPLNAEAEADEPRELETDRDAFTPATSTVGQRLTVLEASYSFIDNRSVAETHSLPEMLLRYGLTERIELRLGWNYEVGGAGDIVSGDDGGEEFEGRIERESQMLYGVKVAATTQNGWIPRSAAILQGFTPTSGEATATDVVAAYTFGWELPNSWRLDSSMRYGTEHGPRDAFNEWAPSVVLRVPLNEQWQVHAEYFGIYNQGSEHDAGRAFFSPGAHYLITPNLELGLRLGWGITHDTPPFFSNVGIGWRF